MHKKKRKATSYFNIYYKRVILSSEFKASPWYLCEVTATKPAYSLWQSTIGLWTLRHCEIVMGDFCLWGFFLPCETESIWASGFIINYFIPFPLMESFAIYGTLLCHYFFTTSTAWIHLSNMRWEFTAEVRKQYWTV